MCCASAGRACFAEIDERGNGVCCGKAKRGAAEKVPGAPRRDLPYLLNNHYWKHPLLEVSGIF